MQKWLLLFSPIIILFVSVIALLSSCEKEKTKERIRPQEDCPIPKNRAEEAGSYFESKIVDGNRVIKPWGGHHHEFSELEALGWTSSDFNLAATLSSHADLSGKIIRFADNDIAQFLQDKKLCSLTLKFLYSYLSDQEKRTFLEKIRGVESEGNHLSNLDIIKAHQDKRFSDLEKILAKNPKYHVRFPGKSAKDHYLGTGIAKDKWSPDDHKTMINHLIMLITELMKKYPGRISFGQIGDFKFDPNTNNCDATQVNPQGVPGQQNDGTFMIHVWGANADNFNYENNHKGPFGSGQASCFATQRQGVFGISTMPSGNKADLLADDKLLFLY